MSLPCTILRPLCLACCGLALLCLFAASPALAAEDAAANAATPKTNPWVYGYLTLIMLSAGLGGGIVSFAMTEEQERKWIALLRCVIIALGASFLVPLFLNTISSDLVPGILDGKGASESMFVFAGFCLLAAISARAFIETLSDKVLSEARTARQAAQRAESEVSEMQATVGPIVERVTEADEDEVAALAQMTDREQDVANALSGSRLILRSVNGIARELGLQEREVEEILNELRGKGLAQVVRSRSKVRWVLTSTARGKLSELMEQVRRLPEPYKTVLWAMSFEEDVDIGRLAAALKTTEAEIMALYEQALDMLGDAN